MSLNMFVRKRPKRKIKNFLFSTIDRTVYTCISVVFLSALIFFVYLGFSKASTPVSHNDVQELFFESSIETINPKKAQLINSTTTVKNFKSLTLNKETVALLSFDVPQRKIQKAYISLTVQKSAPTDAYIKISTSDVESPWTENLNWNSVKLGDSIAEQVVFRPVAWESPWLLDVTKLVKRWMEVPASNHGIALQADQEITLFLEKGLISPYLILEYADQLPGKLTDAAKIETGFKTLHDRYDLGPWSWMNVGIINAQLNELKLGKTEYKDNVEAFLDQKPSIESYYQAAFGTVLIKLNPEKYNKEIREIRNLFNTLPIRDGIYLDNGAIESELAYLGLEFLAAYGNKYNDTEATNIAIDQSILLYDNLTKNQTDGIPLSLISKYERGKGWARGVGWLFAGMGKLLNYPNIQKHSLYPELVKRYSDLAFVIAPLQDQSGLWRNIITNKFSNLETTGTALFAIGYLNGMKAGVLETSYLAVVKKAEMGLLSKSLTGTDMCCGFPSNQTLNYNVSIFSNTRAGFGLWLELESLLNGAKRDGDLLTNHLVPPY